MNNRKAENRSDQKGYDIAIEVRLGPAFGGVSLTRKV